MQEKPDRKPTILETRNQLREKYETNLRFIEQLLKEKGELRESVVERLGDIERQMQQLEEENRQLRNRIHELQGELTKLANKQEEESAQLRAVLMQDDSLINVQVVSVQLHSTLDFMEMVTIFGEVVINLVGSENFALCLKRDADKAFIPIHAWGTGRRLDPFRLGEGPLGLQLQTGAIHYWRRTRVGDPSQPMALVPLLLMGEIVGALVLFDLLPQKAEFSPTDNDIFECLSQQAGAALLGASLFSLDRVRPTLDFPADLFRSGH